jgi:hypothetical protein
MKKSSQIARKIVPLRHFFPLKVVPLIEVLLYISYPDVAVQVRFEQLIACIPSQGIGRNNCYSAYECSDPKSNLRV